MFSIQAINLLVNKINSGTFFFVIAALINSCFAEPHYQLGYIHSPPFAIHRSGKEPVGILPDMLLTAMRDNNLNYDVNFLPPARFYRLAMLGKQSQIHMMVRGKPELDKVHVLPAEPTVTIRLSLFWSTLDQEKVTLEQVKNSKLIFIHGYLYAGLPKERRKQFMTNQIIQAPNNLSAIRMLEAGRARYILSYQYMIEAAAKKLEYEGLDKIIIRETGMYVGVHKTAPNAERVLKALQKTLLNYNKNGTYEKIINKYVGHFENEYSIDLNAIRK